MSSNEARAYATVGVPHHDIALLMNISTTTLLKYYRAELDLGKARGNAMIAKTLYRLATVEKNLGALIFWLKAQAGWRETSIVQNQALDKNGNPANPPTFGISFSDGGPGLPSAAGVRRVRRTKQKYTDQLKPWTPTKSKPMNTDTEASMAALKAAKIERRTRAAMSAQAAVSAAAACAGLDVSGSEIATLQKRRDAAVAAAKPDDVIAIDALLLRARVSAEIAASKATSLKEAHADLLQASRAAVVGVQTAARAVIDGEMIELANAFNDAFDHAMEIAGKLQSLSRMDTLNTPLNVQPPTLPPLVLRTLERIPQPLPHDVPMHLLRNGVHSDAWSKRLAELTANEPSLT